MRNHLGSSNWITDHTGYPIQFLRYLPYGELQVEQRATDWNSMYTFSGKEKDEETGYSYFGARYYIDKLGIWMSVDPLHDKRPWESPYSYCGNNPLNRVDPTGMIWDDSELTESQRDKWHKTMNWMREKSPLFKVVYDHVDNSQETYKVKIGQTKYGDKGQFLNNTITFLTEQNMTSADTYLEEIFHVYQKDNDALYESGKEFNKEFEAKVAKYLMANQAGSMQPRTKGTNFEVMGNFLSPDGLGVNMPNAETIKGNTFQSGYMKGAESFMNWNKANKFGDNDLNYQKPTEQSPKSLIKMFGR